MALTLAVQLLLLGGYGVPSKPPLAFDLLGGEAFKQSKKLNGVRGVARFGPEPPHKNGEADGRPLTIAPRSDVNINANSRASWAMVEGDSETEAALKALPSAFGGGAGLSYWDNRFPRAWAFRSSAFLAANEGFGLRGFVSSVSSSDGEQSPKGHIYWARWGKAAKGFLFQIRDGNAELFHLSRQWNEIDEKALRLLWQISEPTAADLAQIETLQAKIFDAQSSLSFENALGHDSWRGQMWSLFFVPQPHEESESGVLNIIMEGAGQALFDLTSSSDYLDSDGVARPPIGTLWDATSLTIGATGGAAHWQISDTRFDATEEAPSTMEWGPFKTGYWADGWAPLQKQVRISGQSGVTYATLEKVDVDVVRFKFLLKMWTSDPRYTPWVHGITARLPAGVREVDSDAQTWDSLAQPGEEDPHVSTRLQVSENGRRTAELVIRDVKGRATGGKSLDNFLGHVATLNVGGESWLSGGIITRARWNDLKQLSYEPEEGEPQRGGFRLSKGETRFELSVDDGATILDETMCDPPIVSDNKRLGLAIRDLLTQAGATEAEMANVPANLGVLIPKPRFGQPWLFVADENTSVSSAIQGLLDRFGAGLRFGRDGNGVWYLEEVPETIKAEFTSDYTKNDPTLTRGGTRSVILNPLVWERDNSNYHTIFNVVGGEKGAEIKRTLVNRQAVKLAGGGIIHVKWRGSHKYYQTVRDAGLRTVADVLFALRSLYWRYGRPGRIAQFQTYEHRSLKAWDRVTVDGILCEVVSWEIVISPDSPFGLCQLRVREVV